MNGQLRILKTERNKNRYGIVNFSFLMVAFLDSLRSSRYFKNDNKYFLHNDNKNWF